MSIYDELERLGIELPAAVVPVANYLGTKRVDQVLYVSGRVSELRGEVGTDVSLDEAYAAARHTALVLLAVIEAEVGTLDMITSIHALRGFVRSGPGFTQQPQVIDGASDLLVDLLGDDGRHARTATGAAQLPYGAAVQLDMTVGVA